MVNVIGSFLQSTQGGKVKGRGGLSFSTLVRARVFEISPFTLQIAASGFGGRLA